MKKTPKKMRKKPGNGLRVEYRFDYSKSRPNRFATSKRRGKRIVAVVLEPDVATVFDSSDSVNRFLRSVISALPQGERRAPAQRRNAS